MGLGTLWGFWRVDYGGAFINRTGFAVCRPSATGLLKWERTTQFNKHTRVLLIRKGHSPDRVPEETVPPWHPCPAPHPPPPAAVVMEQPGRNSLQHAFAHVSSIGHD